VTGYAFSTQPLEFIASDIIGPFDLYDFNDNPRKFWLISYIDIATRFVSIQPLYKITGKAIVKTLKRWMNEHQIPNFILTDQGKGYISNEFKNFCKGYQIKNKYTSIYNPTCNGIAERINKTIKNCLRIYKKKI
jgi:transposase InsO family protein